MDGRPPPPPPPPHPPPHGNGSSGNAKASDLPPGNYDIFVIPPHSSGSGFLYLPSLQPQRNSFLAGAVCALAAVGVWVVVLPMLQRWASTVFASGGMSVVLLLVGVGVFGWAYGKTQMENDRTGRPNSGQGGSAPGGTHMPNPDPSASPGANASGFTNLRPNPGYGTSASTGAKSSWQRSHTTPGTTPASSSWEKAREETKKKEEERKRKEDAEKKAEKERWEKIKAREREAREKEIREKMMQEKLKRERAAKEAPAPAEPTKRNYQKPSAQTCRGDDEAYSFRPYDEPKRPKKTTSQSSYLSESSYAPSQSTARTTPPPSHRGPYANKDPDKIMIRAVYGFNDMFVKPFAQLVSGVGNVTDGLVLKMTTEGLFIDDDVRGVPQREWDVKAWTMKLVEVSNGREGPTLSLLPARSVQDLNETACLSMQVKRLTAIQMQTGDMKGKHVLRASIRDADNRKYVFIIEDSEAWKVAVGLQKVRKGSQVRSLGVSGLPASETRSLLTSLGWA